MKYREFFKEDLLSGGKGDDVKLSKFDPEEVRMGIKTEKEHTNDIKKAKEITADHLSENPKYYSLLKKSGLADELKEGSSIGIVEPDIQSIDKQTTQGTVFPPVNRNPSNGGSCVGLTGEIEPNGGSSNVDAQTKDPTPTDHVTGGMASAAPNPNILPKDDSDQQNVNGLQTMMKAALPRDISIDIAESKKILNKMMKETTIGPKNAFGLNMSNENETEQTKEGYGGDPDTDKAFVKGKRWTVKWKQ